MTQIIRIYADKKDVIPKKSAQILINLCHLRAKIYKGIIYFNLPLINNNPISETFA